MAKLADALDSKSCSERSVGSTPTLGTNEKRDAASADNFLKGKQPDIVVSPDPAIFRPPNSKPSLLPPMKLLRTILALGFVSMLFTGAAQAAEAKKEEGKACCECCKGSCDTAKKAEKKP
jgi:hypothetical protein